MADRNTGIYIYRGGGHNYNDSTNEWYWSEEEGLDETPNNISIVEVDLSITRIEHYAFSGRVSHVSIDKYNIVSLKLGLNIMCGETIHPHEYLLIR